MKQPHPAVTTFMDAWSAMDAEGYAAAFAPSFTVHDPTGVVTTLEGLNGHVETMKKNWSHASYDVFDVAGEGDHQAVGYTMTFHGHGGGFEGKVVKLDGIAFVTLQDGKITQWREVFDTGVFRRALKSKAA